ncbi:MAG: GNAT family N-acetyltransferase [Actinomycetota bacterium]|nr:GNAT family N-acetyltransferase [Actinomycetota bacterium]
MSEIETARLLLRRWREGDLEAYARICADPEVKRYLSGTTTREQSEAQIAGFVRHWEERGFGLWAAEHRATGAFVGFVGLLYSQDWPEGEHKTEVGWRLDRSFWGRGLATEGALASLRYGFERLGLERIISITLPQNVASRRAMEKTGLAFQGERRWRNLDGVWYAIDYREWESQSRELTG